MAFTQQDFQRAIMGLTNIIASRRGEAQQQQQFGAQMQMTAAQMQQQRDQFLSDLKFRREVAEEQAKLDRAADKREQERMDMILRDEERRVKADELGIEAKRGYGQYWRGKTEGKLAEPRAGAEVLSGAMEGKGLLEGISALFGAIPEATKAAKPTVTRAPFESFGEFASKSGLSDEAVGAVAGMLNMAYEDEYTRQMKDLNFKLASGEILLREYQTEAARLDNIYKQKLIDQPFSSGGGRVGGGATASATGTDLGGGNMYDPIESVKYELKLGGLEAATAEANNAWNAITGQFAGNLSGLENYLATNFGIKIEGIPTEDLQPMFINHLLALAGYRPEETTESPSGKAGAIVGAINLSNSLRESSRAD